MIEVQDAKPIYIVFIFILFNLIFNEGVQSGIE